MQPQLHKKLAPLTTFHIGGEAEYFFTVRSVTNIYDAVTYAQDRQLPWTLLGGGSNVLIADAGIAGVVMHNQLKGITIETVSEDMKKVSASAGEVFDEVVTFCVTHGLCGLENLSHIPGSVGAAPIQNIGAYGVEVADVIESVTVFDPEVMAERKLTHAECQFAYRDSYFKTAAGKRLIVTAVHFLLPTQAAPNVAYRDLAERFTTAVPTPQTVRAAVIDVRSKKFPDWHTVGTAGSFFKNPIISRIHYTDLIKQYPDMPMYVVDDMSVKVPLAWILDKVCDRKGLQKGTVGHYSEQPLVIINHGGATAKEVASFANEVVVDVKLKTDIDIEWEVTQL